MDEDGLQHVHLEMEAKNVALFGLDRFTSCTPFIAFPIWVPVATYVIVELKAETEVGVGWQVRLPPKF